jgi:RNA polymerase sigma-70 factor (ECF subfamily)
MKGETDERLMERYADGDADAFAELFGRYERRAYRFFVGRTRSEERAWDLFQDLFLRLHRFRGTYRAGGPFAPWFFQIARRVLLDDLRRDRSSREVPLGSEIARSAESDAERRVADVEQAEQLLGRLSSEQGFVLLAGKVEGLGCAEIAERLGKSVAAVKQVASRGLRKLRTVEGFAA